MNKELNLVFEKGEQFEGFRRNSIFTALNQKTMSSLSDDLWDKNPIMNTDINISSPTSSILDRYYVNILTTILLGVSNNNLNKIIIYKPNEIELDRYSCKIFERVKKMLPIEVVSTTVRKKKNLNPNNMRKAIKRGFYYEFEEERSVLYEIYRIYGKIFMNHKINISELTALLQLEINDYEKWLLVKLIINTSIREFNFEVTEKYLGILYNLKKNNFDYWNSKSYYLLKKEGNHHAYKYLKNKLNTEQFLLGEKVDLTESLVFKNYASMLKETSLEKKQILEKCLEHTPQDIDLWIYYFSCYSNKEKERKIYKEFVTNGYSELFLYKNIILNKGEDELVVRLIVILYEMGEVKLAKKYITSICSSDIKIKLEKYLEGI